MTARQMSSSSFHYPTKVLNFIDTRPKDNEVKGAVKLDPILREYLLSAAVEESSSDDSSSSVDQSFLAFLQQKLANAIPTTFAVFDKQDQPLSDFVAQLCSQMGLLGADEEQKAAAVDGKAAVKRHFALMFDDRRSFLTEANKHGLQQGFILKLTASPANYARHFLTKLGSSRRPLSADQLSLLNSMCADCAFAEAFHQQQGIQRLANMIEEAADWHPFFDSNGSGSLLLGLMHALLQLMQMYPQLVPWSSISSQFVRKIAFLVNGQSKLEQNDSRALALDMLLVLAEHCDHLHECLKREVPVDSLIRHLDNTDQRVLLGSTRLMNAIYVLGERAERICIVKLLHERPFLAAIGRVLAREGSSSIPGSSQVGGPAAAARTSTATTSPPPPPSLPPSPISEQRAQLWEQLARLQHIRFDEVRALALRSPSDMEIDFLKKLEAFNGGIAGDDVLFESAAAYGNDEAEAAAEEGNLYGNIGFQQQRRQQSSDWEQFRAIVRSTPPGLLAICAILDLTQPPQPAAILQQQQQQSPEEAASAAAMAANQAWARLQELDAHFIGRPSLFPQILARLAQMLLQVLGICGESSVGQRFGHQRLPHFWRLVLTCERPFYDLFRTVVELFCRTWRDMNAKPEELDKVFSVVQDQLERAMVEDPESLEQLEREMLRKRFSYFNMQKIWKREQLEQEELELNSEDIQPLRDYLRPKFERLVLQKRISLLKRGLTFQRVLPAKPKDPQNTPLSSSPASSLSTAAAASFSSSTAVHSSPVHSGHVNLNQQQPQHWFWRLDERERHFHVWDCGGGRHKELVLDSQEKLPISQIRAVLHGPELVARLQQQHGLKPQKKGQNVLRCGLGLETQLAAAHEYFLCAQTEQELASWLEALNCLCWPQKALENAALRAEVDRLLGMEVHIRLMDIPPQRPKHKKPSAAEVPELPTDLMSWIPLNMLLQPERA